MTLSVYLLEARNDNHNYYCPVKTKMAKVIGVV